MKLRSSKRLKETEELTLPKPKHQLREAAEMTVMTMRMIKIWERMVAVNQMLALEGEVVYHMSALEGEVVYKVLALEWEVVCLEQMPKYNRISRSVNLLPERTMFSSQSLVNSCVSIQRLLRMLST